MAKGRPFKQFFELSKKTNFICLHILNIGGNILISAIIENMKVLRRNLLIERVTCVCCICVF